MDHHLNENIIKDLTKAFSEDTDVAVNEVKDEYNLGTGNYKSRLAWDLRFQRIKDAALKHNLTVLERKKGFWDFNMVLDYDSGNLFIFSKDNNLETVKKNFGKHKIHYFHACISKSEAPIDLGDQQLELFPTLTEEYEERRIREAQKLLSEDYSSVQNVFFITAKEENHKFSNVEIKLYNSYFELTDREDLSRYIDEVGYSEALDVVTDEEDNEEQPLIPALKPELLQRKESMDSKIPQKRTIKKEKEEE